MHLRITIDTAALHSGNRDGVVSMDSQLGFPDIQVCGTHGREDLVNATITSNAEEEDYRLLIIIIYK